MPSIPAATDTELSVIFAESWKRDFSTQIDIPVGSGPDNEICPLYRMGEANPEDATSLSNVWPRQFETDPFSRFVPGMCEGSTSVAGTGYIEYKFDSKLRGDDVFAQGETPVYQQDVTMSFSIWLPLRDKELLRSLYTDALVLIFRQSKIGEDVWSQAQYWPAGRIGKKGIFLIEQQDEPPLEAIAVGIDENDKYEKNLFSIVFRRYHYGSPAN